MTAIQEVKPAIDDGRKLLTHSRIACAKKCLRAHYYSYELGIKKARKTAPLRIGTAFHVGLDAYGKGLEPEAAAYKAGEAYQEIPEWADGYEWCVEYHTVQRLLLAYFDWWKPQNIEVVASEVLFDLPIINPETNAEGRSFRLAGKIDKIVRLPDTRLALMEHKTCGADIGPESDYWKRLRLDHQISLYMLAARRLGYDVQTVFYDVTRKPSIAPYRATPTDKRKFKKDGTLYANLREHDETPEEFAARLSDDIASRPEFYFQRREIPRLEADLKEFEWELWQTQQLLRDCQRHGRWFRNSAACLQPFKCEYFDLCSQGVVVGETVPPGFVKVPYVHQELEED